MTMKITTQRLFESYTPGCFDWAKLLTSLNKTRPDNTPVSLEHILNSNGIRDAVWALRFFEYKEYCLFLADVAESVLPLFEKEHKNDDSPRKLIQLIRDYHADKVSKTELENAAKKVENNNYNDYIANSVCCVAIFAANAHDKKISPFSAIYIATEIDASIENEVTEPLFRKYFCNNSE